MIKQSDLTAMLMRSSSTSHQAEACLQAAISGEREEWPELPL